MKNVLLIAVLFLCCSFSKAQEETDYTYCEIVGTAKILSTKVVIAIDFGQATTIFTNTILKGEDGKPMVFNSMIDALNFMGNEGWEFVQAYAITYTNNGSVYHYLLKKKKEVV